jgi:hypothetical protein
VFYIARQDFFIFGNFEYWGYLMKTISLKIDDSIFGETERMLSAMQKTRNKYINDAIEYYNTIQQYKIIEKKLKKESLLVKDDSMAVLKEFESISDEYQAI